MIEPFTGVREEFPTRPGYISFRSEDDEVRINFDSLGRARISVEAVAQLIVMAYPEAKYSGVVYGEE